MMRATLAALAMFLMLGCAAALGEEAAGVSEATRGKAGLCTGEFRTPGAAETGAMWLGLAVGVVFIVGLVRKRHEWKPLVLGLFALGLGMLGMTLEFMESYETLINVEWPIGSADLCMAAKDALLPMRTGLVIALAGGFFTVILHWRNERVRTKQAGAKAEKAAEG